MSERLGYLASCMDRRFVVNTRRAFEKETGLSETQYWHESWPGGAAVPQSEVGEDYAYSHGARAFGWQAHGSTCGGQPGVSDQEIQQRLDTTIHAKVEKFPDADHYRIFVTEDSLSITKVKPQE